MTPRIYRSLQRAAGAAETRDRILAAAVALLGDAEGIPRFSLESVAKAAAVTRLTVYNQFGSRSTLLEAVFDYLALTAGLGRLQGAISDADPQAGLRRLIGIFCDFWSYDSSLIGRLHVVGAGDPEFSGALSARNERRRHTLSVLINRLADKGIVPSAAASELIDVLFALTSFSFFAALTIGGRSTEITYGIIQDMAEDAVKRADANANGRTVRD